jgi:hypothetical protein
MYNKNQMSLKSAGAEYFATAHLVMVLKGLSKQLTSLLWTLQSELPHSKNSRLEHFKMGYSEPFSKKKYYPCNI